jgi:thioredoxin 1
MYKNAFFRKEQAMSKVTEITDANFEQHVLNSDQPVLVDFWAEWCGPCRALGPVIEELARDYEGRATIGKLNVDENQQMAERFGIASIPAVLVFSDGEEVERLIGVQPKGSYEQALNQLAS